MWYDDAPNIVLFAQDFFDSQGLLWFHIYFRMFSPSSLKNAMMILIDIALNLQITSGKMIIFIVLILPIHEHGRTIHILVFFCIYFTKSAKFFILEIFSVLD